MTKSLAVPFLGVALLIAAPIPPSLAQSSAAPDQPAVPATRIDRLDPALDSLIAPDVQIEQVATGFTFTGRPLSREGRLWFSDVRGDKLRAVSPDGKVELLLDNQGGIIETPGLD